MGHSWTFMGIRVKKLNMNDQKLSNQIHDNSRTKHIVPELSRRVFKVFVLFGYIKSCR